MTILYRNHSRLSRLFFNCYAAVFVCVCINLRLAGWQSICVDMNCGMIHPSCNVFNHKVTMECFCFAKGHNFSYISWGFTKQKLLRHDVFPVDCFRVVPIMLIWQYLFTELLQWLRSNNMSANKRAKSHASPFTGIQHVNRLTTRLQAGLYKLNATKHCCLFTSEHSVGVKSNDDVVRDYLNKDVGSVRKNWLPSIEAGRQVESGWSRQVCDRWYSHEGVFEVRWSSQSRLRSKWCHLCVEMPEGSEVCGVQRHEWLQDLRTLLFQTDDNGKSGSMLVLHGEFVYPWFHI